MRETKENQKRHAPAKLCECVYCSVSLAFIAKLAWQVALIHIWCSLLDDLGQTTVSYICPEKHDNDQIMFSSSTHVSC